MVYQKIFAFVLCFLLVGQSLAQKKLADEPKKLEISAELKEKALNLLNSLARESEQFYLAENRVGARILTANLLWDFDEKQARVVFQNAIADLNSMIGQIQPEAEDNVDERYLDLNTIKTLRTELLLALAARDPVFALEALQALSGKDSEGEDLFTEDKTLQLGIAAQIAQKDPKQAYELAKKNLDNDLEYGVLSALEDIFKKDAELGARFAKDIAAKIKEKKIFSPYDYMASNMANTNTTNRVSNVSTGSYGNGVSVWQVQLFIDTVKRLNRLAAKDGKTLVLSENDIKEIVELLAQKYINQPYLSAYEVAKIMPEINKHFPGLAQAIRRKLAANNGGAELDNQIRVQTIQDEITGRTSEEIFQLAEKKPVGERDDFYRQAAEKAVEEGNVTKAKDYYGKIKKKQEYDYLDERIESELPLALAKNGDLRATREMLSKLKTIEERIDVLTNLAVGIAAKGDKKTALALAEEARALFAGRMKQRKNLMSILQLGYAYSTIDAAQGFAVIESNMTFINEVISAGIILDEFNEMGSVKNDEVRLEIVRNESYRNMKNGVVLIKNLANADFERMATLADRFLRSEARFFARYRIAEALLNPTAEEDEKKTQSNIDERYYGDI